jgi:hypothetical protein
VAVVFTTTARDRAAGDMSDMTAATAVCRRRITGRTVALGGIVASAAVFSSGCTLSDVSTVLSILRFLGIGG